MLSNYFTLAALAREWADALTGSMVEDIYSPRKDELVLELSRDDSRHRITVSVHPGFHFIFRGLRAGRPKSNVTTLFEDAIGATVQAIEIHPSDRILTFRLAADRQVQTYLYGSRANVLLVGPDGRVHSAFKRSGDFEGRLPPAAKPVPNVELKDALAQEQDDETLERLLRHYRPRFGAVLIRESLFRAGLDGQVTAPLPESDVDRLDAALQSVQSDMAAPSPRTYLSNGSELLSIIALSHLDEAAERAFSTVDEAVRRVVLDRTRTVRLRNARQPLVKALERAVDKARKRLSDLERGTSAKSRADEYERWGHLLMANPQRDIEGETLALVDVFGDGTEVIVPVKPGLSVIENAQRYYEKAKSLRAERKMLGERLHKAGENLQTVERLLAEAGKTTDLHGLEQFRRSHAEALRRFIGGRSEAAPPPTPFRRFIVSGALTVLVGRNAQENDRLTFDYASPFDLWFHARGVAGSHVVLRIPGRKASVSREAREAAASIAAWFSSARGSSLAPVIMTERKYVSKPRGSDPGAVRVHREEVLMVKPGLPD